jgi:hypothetical protein
MMIDETKGPPYSDTFSNPSEAPVSRRLNVSRKGKKVAWGKRKCSLMLLATREFHLLFVGWLLLF